MILIINTAENNKISLSLKDGDSSSCAADKFFVDEIVVESKFTQAERLLPLIDELLVKNGKTLPDLKKIGVVNNGDGFTSLRIGVITANALAYALGVPVYSVSNEGVEDLGNFNIAKPIYSREPNIT